MSIYDLLIDAGLVCIFTGIFLIKKSSKYFRSVLLIGICLMFSPAILPRQIFGTWNAIKKLNHNHIKKILLQPSEPGYDVNLTDSTVAISDDKYIDSLISLLRRTEVYFPNRSERIWETSLILLTDENDSLVLEIKKTLDNGTGIFTSSNKLRNDKIDDYLEFITSFKKPFYGYKKSINLNDTLSK